MYYQQIPSALTYIIFPGGAGGNFVSVLLSDMSIVGIDMFEGRQDHKFHYTGDRNEWRVPQPRLFKPWHPDLFFVTGRRDSGLPTQCFTKARYREVLSWSTGKRIVYILPGKAIYNIKALYDYKQQNKRGDIEYRKQLKYDRYVAKEVAHNQTFAKKLRQAGADIYTIDYTEFFANPSIAQIEDLQRWLFGRSLREEENPVDPSIQARWVRRIQNYHLENQRILTKYIYGNDN